MPHSTFKQLSNLTAGGTQRTWRWLIPIFLVLSFPAILLWLPWQYQQMETNHRQNQLIAATLWIEQTISSQQVQDARIPQYTQPYNLLYNPSAIYTNYSLPLFTGRQYLDSLISIYTVSSILSLRILLTVCAR